MTNLKQPTTPITPVTLKGGLVNGSFDLSPSFVAAQTVGNKFIDGTSTGSSTIDQYRWFAIIAATSCSLKYDSTVSYIGSSSIKLSTTDTTGRCRVIYGGLDIGVASNSALVSKYGIPVIAGTQYILTGYCKTNNVATNSAFIDIGYWNTSGAVVAGNPVTSKLTGTNDFTKLTVTFTIPAGAIYASIRCLNDVVGNIGDAWFDNITLQQVSSINNTYSTNALFFPSITAVSSTNNVDQSQLTGDSTVGLGYTNQKYTVQQFFPTKKNIVGFVFQKNADNGNYTQDTTFSIQTDNSGKPSGTILTSTFITNATYHAYPTLTDIVIPFTQTTLTPGTPYWIVMNTSNVNGDPGNFGVLISSATDIYTGLYGNSKDFTTFTFSSKDLYFKILYSENTANLSVSNGTQNISVNSPTTSGWASGTLIDTSTLGINPLTLTPGSNTIYYSSNDSGSVDSAVDPSLQGTIGGFYGVPTSGGADGSIINDIIFEVFKI